MGLIAFLIATGALSGTKPYAGAVVLKPERAKHYFDNFASEERAFLHDGTTAAWPWFAHNIPLLDVPDKDLQEVYYFRWYSFQKHIRHTPTGSVIDEFLDNVPWAGKDNSIDLAAEHHIREARWLRDPTVATQDAHFWLTPGAEPRRYSLALAHAIDSLTLATGDLQLAVDSLPKLIENYRAWEETHLDPLGLFWQIDDRDGMEDSIGGSGYRPTINSYMYGDAVAISHIAILAGKESVAHEYAAKAERLRALVEQKLWNPKARFYETVPRAPGVSWVGVRELMGYAPWYFELPHLDRIFAWKQLNDPQGFFGAYGPTTAERRSPRFRFADPHECLWNGPSWPFATTQTLVALANVLNGPAQDVVGPQDYWDLLQRYVKSQHLVLPDGQVIPWIDEDLDADTGEWIARGILEAKHQKPPNRGRYYNHSGFADLVITGLFGLRPSEGTQLTIHPLLPPGVWSYFALERVPYHGHLLSLLWDESGQRYRRGAGFRVFCDGQQIYSNAKLTAVSVRLP